MAFEPKKFDSLIGMEGFSEQLLKNHFSLYQGYVKNASLLVETLNSLLKENKTASPEFAELKRRLSWEWNGIRLHELYFGNMSKEGAQLDKNSGLAKKIETHFGSFENWERDFKAAGAMRGIGWVVLYYDAVSEKLFNAWINEHDCGHLAGAAPVLVMDVFEHAYMVDYGIKKADYIEAFFKVIDWSTVEKRFDGARRNNFLRIGMD